MDYAMIPLVATLVVLGAQVSFGTSEVPGATQYEWSIEYEDTTTSYTTSVPRVDFSPRAGRRFRVSVRADSGPWSVPSYEVVADPLPGDVNFDCAVGSQDFVRVRKNYGDACTD